MPTARGTFVPPMPKLAQVQKLAQALYRAWLWPLAQAAQPPRTVLTGQTQTAATRPTRPRPTGHQSPARPSDSSAGRLRRWVLPQLFAGALATGEPRQGLLFLQTPSVRQVPPLRPKPAVQWAQKMARQAHPAQQALRAGQPRQVQQLLVLPATLTEVRWR